MAVGEVRYRLLDHACDVARRFYAFGAYRGSTTVAVRALERRSPGHAHYDDLLAEALSLYAAAKQLVRHAYEEELWRQTDLEAGQMPDWTPLDVDLAPRFATFPAEIRMGVLNWVYYWHYLR